MLRRPAIITLTFLLWVIVCSYYGYYVVSSCMADSRCYEYEGIWVLPSLGFIIYKVPFLTIGLIIVVALEWKLIPRQR